MMSPELPASTAARYENGRLTDILVVRNGRVFPLLGAAGPQRELGFLPAETVFPGGMPRPADTDSPLPQSCLPVLVGSGTGVALAEIVLRLERAHGPSFRLLVVDKETDILEQSDLCNAYADHAGIRWITAPDSADCLRELTRLQTDAGGLPFFPLTNPFYLRLDREYYAAVDRACTASGKANFWDQARYAKFTGDVPRLLLLTSSYFLMGEIVAACERLRYPHYLLQLPEKEIGQTEFVEALLAAVLEFKPDFVFTINHLGVDREGILTDLLEKLRLPLASWFVDNPHLILHLYPRLASSFTAIFTWDTDNIASLSEHGFSQVSYLPLGVDAVRFHPPRGGGGRDALQLPKAWDGRVSFVGNSMVSKVRAREMRTPLPETLLQGYEQVASAFGASAERSVRAFLQADRAELLPAFDALPDIEARLGYEAMITWEATRQYRLDCIRSILPFAPLIAGDPDWKSLFDPSVHWHYHGELNYYHDLPRFYPLAAVNFNCTSKQMKGAVNQRVFDVPATEAFLLTDYREQVENLFEPGREIICYHSPEEATALAEDYLANPAGRAAVAKAARRRIENEHSYEHRVQTLTERMRSLFK